MSDYVYFVQGSDPSGPIKIGVATNPGDRLVSMQCGNWDELCILGTVRAKGAAHRVEARLHQKYAASRVRGEWFARTDALVAEICNLCYPNEDLDLPAAGAAV